ncbi:MAG: thioredoxin family protein [Saprospiraceae bacterium]|nr:thioredoxin family protein [Saprospiraceae bacterium]
MMKFIQTYLLLLFFSNVFFAQNSPIKQEETTADTVTFIHESFNEAIQKARAEQKLLFVDAYTTWCAPCKMMDKKTFNEEEVAEYFNEKFVNLKLDMEQGEGLTIQQRYKVVAFPTLLFLNGDGEVIHKVLGFQDAEQLLAIGKIALTSDQTFAAWTSRYDKGDREPKFLKEYAEKLSEAYDDRRFTVAEEYFATQTDSFSAPNLDFSMRFTEGVESPRFPFLVKHKEAFAKKFTKDDISLKIEELVTDFLMNDKNLPTLGRADSLIRFVYPEKADRMTQNYHLSYYRMKGDRDNYASSAVKYFKKYDDNADELSETATTFLEQIEDKTLLSKATKWAKRATKKQITVTNKMILAQLLQKLGKTKKARKAAEEAVEIGKKLGQNYDEATVFLKEL